MLLKGIKKRFAKLKGCWMKFKLFLLLLKPRKKKQGDKKLLQRLLPLKLRGKPKLHVQLPLRQQGQRKKRNGPPKKQQGQLKKPKQLNVNLKLLWRPSR